MILVTACGQCDISGALPVLPVFFEIKRILDVQEDVSTNKAVLSLLSTAEWGRKKG
jgi:hypothetical protein